MSAGKTFQIYIPGDMLDGFQKRVDKAANGNASGYVQGLHLDEAKAKGGEDTARAVVALAELYHPTIARALELQLNHGRSDKPVRQDHVVYRMLGALHIALERQFDPESPFAIYSSEEEFNKVIRTKPEILRCLGLVAAELEHRHMLNEKAVKTEVEPVGRALLAERQRRGARGSAPGDGTIPGGKVRARTRKKL